MAILFTREWWLGKCRKGCKAGARGSEMSVELGADRSILLSGPAARLARSAVLGQTLGQDDAASLSPTSVLSDFSLSIKGEI